MEGERLIEETHVQNVSLFTSPSIEQEKGGIIVFRVYDTKHLGGRGTLLPNVAWLRFDSYFLESLYGDKSLVEDEVHKAVAKVDCFEFETAKVLARELCCYMRSCYGFYKKTYMGMHPCSKSTNDFLVVIVAEVRRTVVTEDYLAVKLDWLDEQNQLSPKKEVIKEVFDDGAQKNDDMGSDMAHDEDDDKGSVISSDMDMDDDYDDDDDEDDDKDSVMSTDMDDDYDDDDDDGDEEVAMEEEEGNVVYGDDDKKVTNSGVIEGVKYILCQEIGVPYTNDTLIELVEVKPSLTIEEMKVETMDDGSFKPLIDSINTKLTNDVECSICITSFAEKLPKSSKFPWCPKMNSWRIVKLKCGHVFHHECIFEWLSKAPSCPLCRSFSPVYV